jgi:hypothetical protein
MKLLEIGFHRRRVPDCSDRTSRMKHGTFPSNRITSVSTQELLRMEAIQSQQLAKFMAGARSTTVMTNLPWHGTSGGFTLHDEMVVGP